jgi:pentatricopeptide repeat protein
LPIHGRAELPWLHFQELLESGIKGKDESKEEEEEEEEEEDGAASGTTVLAGYVQNGLGDEALKFFAKMMMMMQEDQAVSPDAGGHVCPMRSSRESAGGASRDESGGLEQSDRPAMSSTDSTTKHCDASGK